MQGGNAVHKINTGQKSENTIDEVNKTKTAELILPLCGPVGTDMSMIAKTLQKLIAKNFGYECLIIKLSDCIRELIKNEPLFLITNPEPPKHKKFENIQFLIEAGNHLRKKYGSTVLGEMAIYKMFKDRVEDQQKNSEPKELPNDSSEDETIKFEPRRCCYIIDSIKNKEELEVLREVYRDLVYFIGVFSPLRIQVKNLKKKKLQDSEIFSLIDRDSGEEILHGQAVRETFPKADFFLRVDSDHIKILEQKLLRFLDLVFGTEVITPTTHETAMYMATAASGNSACLSRQVGACITDEKGEIISLGWNDVPKFGGNLYQNYSFDDQSKCGDNRCMNILDGRCSNDEQKNIITEELVELLLSKKLIDETQKEPVFVTIRNSKIKSLIEFSRAIHAEMHAIIIGSQVSGTKMRNGALFCTTYPCHNCARHIVVAGIKEVYYIEPYSKSLSVRLHDDSVTEDEFEKNKVKILMFDGVAPSKYMQFFREKVDSRKSNLYGAKNIKTRSEVKPKSALSIEAIYTLEGIAAKVLEKKGFQLD